MILNIGILITRNYLNSIVFQRNSLKKMHKQHKKLLNRLVSAEQQLSGGDAEGRLDSIIKTFRQNNLKLMLKIGECDRKREIQQQINKKKLSQKYFPDKFEYPIPWQHGKQLFSNRPLSQLKTQRRIEKEIKDFSRKQNVVVELANKIAQTKSEECQENEFYTRDDKNLKVIKINVNRLVPLTIDKLKERMRAKQS